MRAGVDDAPGFEEHVERGSEEIGCVCGNDERLSFRRFHSSAKDRLDLTTWEAGLRLVEDEDLRLLCEGARKKNASLLTAGKVRRSRRKPPREAVFRAELRNLRTLERTRRRLSAARVIGSAEQDVLFDGSSQELGLLAEASEHARQIVHANLADILAVDRDASLRRIVET